jgi:Zn-dependent alcohol dehydrogenase
MGESAKSHHEDAMQIKAAVFRKPHEPLTIETIELDDPAPRE